MDLDFKIGDKISYVYPNPSNTDNVKFVGVLDTIGDAFVYIKNDEGVRLKVSFKHFHLLKHYKEHHNPNQ
ncbi:MAG: hypothetical protein KJ571_19160 [Bacteroidetes bacterium]|nr:hypothetical protein [Bacteroidota bacterium]